MNEKKGFAKDINIKELIKVMRKRLWIIVIMTAVTTIAGIVYNANTATLLYQSSTRIIIGADSELMKTLQVIIRDSTVLEKVAEKLNLNRSPEGLASQIAVQSLDSSQVVSITVVDTDPKMAAAIANTTAEVFKVEIPRIINFNEVSILSKAKINANPINEDQNRTIISAFVFGLIAGIGLVFFLDSLDETVKSEKEVEEYLVLPVLGRISQMNKKNINKQHL